MALKVAVALAALVAVCLALPDSRPTYLYAAPSESEESHERAYVRSSEEDYGPAKYDFNYAVKDDDSGNDFGHQESRDGDRTEGSYYVQLPDGRLQKVTYYVDGDSGFVANVEYEGEAHYPEPESSEEDRVYAPPPRSLYGAPN
ncbi:cuticle protein 7-like [Oratosquilla oratoria]|uniref:cuticle protein 7-like n=1 Tax=Oratosquilla oratoria TaxID=337810 RepID=UPI003F777B1B